MTFASPLQPSSKIVAVPMVLETSGGSVCGGANGGADGDAGMFWDSERVVELEVVVLVVLCRPGQSFHIR
jgi:hypothetical protein